MTPFLRDTLRGPHDGSAIVELVEDRATFRGGRSYPCRDGRPVLLDERESLFSIADVLNQAPTTQDRDYRDERQLKNYVRRNLLPGLTWDREKATRYGKLATEVAGKPVLVIGAGDRGEEYRKIFASSTVVLSDVHLQFGTDLVFDAHRIPFADRTFGLVIAAQVLEHVARPWMVAAEMQRVTQIGGTVFIEVPFEFPYHSAPYDFYRFTPSALRFLFSSSELVELGVTEGRFSAAAVFLSHGVVNSFVGRRVRQVALAGTRLGLWWMKYLDAYDGPNRFASPKGIYITVRVDGKTRSDRDLLNEIDAVTA